MIDIYKIGNTPEELQSALIQLRGDFDAHNHDGFNSKAFQTLSAETFSARTILIRKTSFTDSSSGVWMGIAGSTMKFKLGSATSFLSFDGTDINFTGTITGGTFQTAASGQRIVIAAADNYIRIYNAAAQIGALGGSTDGTSRYFDLATPTDVDVEIQRLFAQNTTGVQRILYLISKGYQTGLEIRNENTGATRTSTPKFMINLVQLGTGGALKYANSNPDSDGIVFDIQQSKVATTEPIFKIKQGGITSTNFRKILTETDTGVSIWISDGTTPNGNLTGVLGDICIGGDSGNIYRCSTAGTTWTAM